MSDERVAKLELAVSRLAEIVVHLIHAQRGYYMSTTDSQKYERDAQAIAAELGKETGEQ